MRHPKLPLTSIERKAEFAKHATLNSKPVSRASLEDLGVSWTHLRECFSGVRTPSLELQLKVAAYVGMSPEDFWGITSSIAVAS